MPQEVRDLLIDIQHQRSTWAASCPCRAMSCCIGTMLLQPDNALLAHYHNAELPRLRWSSILPAGRR